MTPRPDSQSRQMQAALQIIAKRGLLTRSVVADAFTIQSRSALSAAGTGASKFPPVNLPAAADSQGGGLCDSSEEITS